MSLGFKLPDIFTPNPDSGAANVRVKRMHRPKPTNCLDCGQAITGKYCSNCGQEAVDHRTALWPMISDALGEFIRWDSKLLRTLLPLMVRPGFLTNEYNAGKRSRYIAPFKLYLTVSVIFFLILAQHSVSDPIHVKIEPVSSARAAIAAKALTTAKSQLSSALGQSGRAAAPGLANGLNAVRAAAAAVTPANGPVPKPAADPYAHIQKLLPGEEGHIKILGGRDIVELGQLPATLAEYQALQRDPKYPYRNLPSTQRVVARFYQTYLDPQLMTRNIEDILPKAMFVLLPLFALIVYTMYWRNGRYYVEHLALTLHNQTFAYIIVAAMILLPDRIAGWLLLAIPLYYFISMLVVYKQHWLTTLVKFSFISFASTVLLTVALVATVLAAFYFG